MERVLQVRLIATPLMILTTNYRHRLWKVRNCRQGRRVRSERRHEELGFGLPPRRSHHLTRYDREIS